MAELDPNVILEMAKTIAAIDERTKSIEKAADHRQGNLKTEIQAILRQLEKYVPRIELDQRFSDTQRLVEDTSQETKKHCDTNREAVLARVAVLEKGQTDILDGQKHIRRAVVGAVIAGSIGLIFAAVRWAGPILMAALHHS